jgi:hypothetical protein
LCPHFYLQVPGPAIPHKIISYLRVSLGRLAVKTPTEYIKFEVANFESSYHAILGRLALAKFMVVPHYVYLLLKLSGKIGALTFCGDLKKSYDCDQEAIEYASITRMPEPSFEVFAATQ